MVASGGKDGVEIVPHRDAGKGAVRSRHHRLGIPDIDGHHVAREIKAESSKTPVHHDDRLGQIMKEDGETAPEVDARGWQTPKHAELNDLLLRIAG